MSFAGGGAPASPQSSYPSLGQLLQMKQMAAQRQGNAMGGMPNAGNPSGPAPIPSTGSGAMPAGGMPMPAQGGMGGGAPSLGAQSGQPMPAMGSPAGGAPMQAAGANSLPTPVGPPQVGPSPGGSNPLALAAMLKNIQGVPPGGMGG